MTKLERRIRDAEARLFARSGTRADESFVQLERAGVRLRVLSVGSGPEILLLHGASLAAAVWASLLPHLSGYRALLVELPGHGLSGAVSYRIGEVRGQALTLVDDLLDALELSSAPVVGHSVGGMFALWHAAARPGRIASLALVGEPAVALPGVTVRMPLSLLTVPVLGRLVLRSPTSRSSYRRLLRGGLSRAAADGAPDELVDVLRLAARRKSNARTIASLMHAIDTFRRARPESVLSDDELRRIRVPTVFCWGAGDPFLAPLDARPSVAKLPAARLHEVPGGHAPWLEDPATCGRIVREHLRSTGLVPLTG